MEEEAGKPPKKRDIKFLTDEFKRLQRQKFSRVGNVEARVLENLCHTQGEISAFVRGGVLRTDPQTDNIVNLNLNLIGPKKRKLKGRLAAICPSFAASPDKNDAKSIDMAEVANKLIRAGDRKVQQHRLTSEILEWLLLGGSCIEHIPWVENASVEPMPVKDDEGGFWFVDRENGEKVPQSFADEAVAMGRPPESFELHKELEELGDFVPEIHGPLTYFVDHTCTDIHKMEPNQSLNFARVKTVAWCKETFKDTADKKKLEKLAKDNEIRIVRTNLSQVGDSRSGVNIKRLLPAIQGSPSEDDPDMVVVVERYGPKSKRDPDGTHMIYVPGQMILKKGPNPYEDGIPAIQYNWEPPIASIYTRDWVHDLIPANLRYSKSLSAMAEYFNAFIKSEKLLGGDLKADDISPADEERIVEGGLGPEGQPLVAFAQPPQVPQWAFEHINTIKAAFDEMAGGADLFAESNFPGQLRGSMGFPALQEILDTEWGPFFLEFGTKMADAKQMRLNRMKQFYQGTRILHYTSHTQRDETLEFKASEVLRAGVEFNINVDVNSLIPELRAMREERVASRIRNFPQLYVDKRTGQFDDSMIARDLQIGDEQREERASQYRKLATQIISRINKAEQPFPLLPFWDLAPMMDEFEAEMSIGEFFEITSPQVQQVMMQYYEQMSQLAQQQAQQMMEAQQQSNMEGIIAQTAQQASAQAANEAVKMAIEQFKVSLQQQAQQGTDLNQMFALPTEQ